MRMIIHIYIYIYICLYLYKYLYKYIDILLYIYRVENAMLCLCTSIHTHTRRSYCGVASAVVFLLTRLADSKLLALFSSPQVIRHPQAILVDFALQILIAD